MNKDDIFEVKQLLSTPKNIVIIPHRNPDGDAMGSSLALYHFLQKLNHSTTVISPNNFPDFLSWLPLSEKVLIYEDDTINATKKLNEAELIFVLDFNALHRTGEMENVLNKLTSPFIMIDHHQSPDGFAKYIYSDTKFGSTCEMIYNFITFLEKEDFIDKTISTCIYTGIVTDSGSFRYPSTTSSTHKIVAKLIENGINYSEIHNLLFDNNSFNRLQLLGRTMKNMKVLPKFKTAYSYLTQKDLDEFHYEKGDTEGFVNYGLTIKGIQIAAIFIENKAENIIKISFRSQGNYDVNEFARNHFNGGGHINAAGGKSVETIQNTILKFEQLVSEIKH